MTQKQIAALINAHTHLLGRIAELETQSVVIREAIFELLDSQSPGKNPAPSRRFEKMFNAIEKDRSNIANRAAGKLQDELLDTENENGA